MFVSWFIAPYLTHPFENLIFMGGETKGHSQRIQCAAWCQKPWPLFCVVWAAKMFAKIISIIILAFTPIVSKLFAIASVAHEPVLHVGRFGRFGLKVFVDESQGGGIVSLDAGGRLFVAHFFQ